ncbi:hypothetical protein FHS18_006024 [Paenibacillus phyllosphaerae]|uniref:Uncharacterized protein n=1 Tax=Paenibacillus phyllosphaerae TaxID=274593 RepID=A0A7W5FRD4_9BACL|nr:hypothetical protein [Paenibacillus phyllosphaerae]MBB3113909.1 hypothetical protein [Paenibacillus phyllosphaerae]
MRGAKRWKQGKKSESLARLSELVEQHPFITEWQQEWKSKQTAHEQLSNN